MNLISTTRRSSY